MKRLALAMVFYCIVHQTSGDFAVQYEGMDKKTIAALIRQTYKAKFDFVDQNTYENFLTSKQSSMKLHSTPAAK